MKALVIGDVHIKNKYHERSIALVEDIIRRTQEEKPDITVLLGDVLDGADIIHSNCLLLLTRLLEAVRTECPVFVLMGNHDASTPHIEMPENHALQCFKNMKDVHIIDFPVNYKGITMIPYLPPGTFSKHVGSDNKLVFCHQEFEGCVFDGGNKSEKGDPIPEGFNIISGHIHSEQKINNLWYVGTPAQTRFGEGSNKGYFLLDIDENTGSYQVIKRLVPEVSRFVSTNYTIGQKIKDLKIKETDVNRAVISATPSEILAFKKSKEYVNVIEMFKGNVKFNVLKEEPSPINQSSDAVTRRSFIESLSSKAKDLGLSDLLEESLRK